MNFYGQRFDLYQTGKHVLLNIPRWGEPESLLLRVEADAQRLGGSCADLYFVSLNITGPWVPVTTGLYFTAQADEKLAKGWQRFGKIQLKVVKGHTKDGLKYLNVFAHDLGKIGQEVGGLLGVDDHSEVSKPGAACRKSMSMAQSPLTKP